MAVGNQAQDPKGSGGYEIGDLEIASPPKRAPSGEQNAVTAQQLAAHQAAQAKAAQAKAPDPAQALTAAKPANTQGGQQAARPQNAKVAGGGQMAALEEPEGPALALELDLGHSKRKEAVKKGPVADVAAQMGYGGKSLGDGFEDPPADAPKLEIEQVDRKAEVIKSAQRDSKAEAAKELQTIAALAGFEDVPGDFIGSARYAIHVLKRTMVLKREREKAVKDAAGLEADLNTALIEMGQAIMAMKTDPQANPLRSQIAAVIDAQSKVSDADRSMSKTREQNQQLVAQMDRQAAELKQSLEPFIQVEQAALETHKKAEDEVKRMQGLQKRAEIELRALSDASAVQDPARAEDLKKAVEERKLGVAQASAAMEKTQAALNAARRELGVKKGALDALEDKKKKLLDELQKKEAEAEQKAKAAEGSHAAALRTLAETARVAELGTKLVPEKNDWATDVEAAVKDARRIVQRYDRALTMFDKSTVTKGWALIGGAVLLLLIAITLGATGGGP